MKLWIKIALAVILVFAIAGIGIGIYFYNLEPADLRKAKPEFVITAVELQQAFENDETLASAKYVNRIIEVNGLIESISIGEENALSVTLQTNSDLSSIICTIPGAASNANLSTGNPIIVRGECSGYLMDVLLNNCVIIK